MQFTDLPPKFQIPEYTGKNFARNTGDYLIRINLFSGKPRDDEPAWKLKFPRCVSRLSAVSFQ